MLNRIKFAKQNPYFSFIVHQNMFKKINYCFQLKFDTFVSFKKLHYRIIKNASQNIVMLNFVEIVKNITQIHEINKNVIFNSNSNKQ